MLDKQNPARHLKYEEKLGEKSTISLQQDLLVTSQSPFSQVTLDSIGCTCNCIFNVTVASPPMPFSGKVTLVKAHYVMMDKRARSQKKKKKKQCKTEQNQVSCLTGHSCSSHLLALLPAEDLSAISLFSNPNELRSRYLYCFVLPSSTVLQYWD